MSKNYSEYLANLHPGDPGLGLKEVVELVLDVLKNRRPAVGVVDRVPVPRGVDHSQGQLHSVLLQLTVVCLHLGGVLEMTFHDVLDLIVIHLKCLSVILLLLALFCPVNISQEH